MAEIKQKITFTEYVEVLDHNGEVSEAYKAGDSVSLPVPSARRWLRRGKAIEAPAKPARKPTRGKSHDASDDSDKDQSDQLDAGPTVE